MKEKKWKAVIELKCIPFGHQQNSENKRENLVAKLEDKIIFCAYGAIRENWLVTFLSVPFGLKRKHCAN